MESLKTKKISGCKKIDGIKPNNVTYVERLFAFEKRKTLADSKGKDEYYQNNYF